MKYILITLSMALVLFSCGNKSHDEHKSMSNMEQKHDTKMAGDMGAGEKFIYYTCPMESHKHVYNREAGDCPECGMALVEGVVTSEDMMEYYGCPMLIHSHIREDEPGRCVECKMELKPMRLKKS